MTKKLVYNFYLTRGTKDSDINRLHLKCIELFSSVFDEMLFLISVDDMNDIGLIKDIEYKLLKLHTKGNITFKIVKNTELRETEAFKNEIVDKMPEDKLVFFAHNKGVTNVATYDKETILYWVAGMYYFSLNYIHEVEYLLTQREIISYGSMLTKNAESNIKYNWSYIGTFFWVNSGSLYNHIKHFNIELPVCSNRFYDEEFLGNIYPIEYYPKSHDCRYIINAVDYYKYAKEYIKIIYEGHGLAEFDDFFNEIINELNITF